MRKTRPHCSAKCYVFTSKPPASGSYSIPLDNPFYGSVDDKQEIWAYGLRNPFRNSFDRLLGTMFIGDVGQVCAKRSMRRLLPALAVAKTTAGGCARARSKNPVYRRDPSTGRGQPGLRLSPFRRADGNWRLRVSRHKIRGARRLRFRGLSRPEHRRLHRAGSSPSISAARLLPISRISPRTCSRRVSEISPCSIPRR